MAESSSFNNVTRQIAREDILNNQRRESFKSYITFSTVAQIDLPIIYSLNFGILGGTSVLI